MPNAVTHILIPIVILELIRDYVIKDRKKFPLHYILIGGIAGLLPDIDVAVYWIINIFVKIPLNEVHRTFSHTLFLPLLFLILGLLTFKVKNSGVAEIAYDSSSAVLTAQDENILDLDASLPARIMIAPQSYRFLNGSVGWNGLAMVVAGAIVLAGAIMIVVRKRKR